jgi:hypothetical protein
MFNHSWKKRDCFPDEDSEAQTVLAWSPPRKGLCVQGCVDLQPALFHCNGKCSFRTKELLYSPAHSVQAQVADLPVATGLCLFWHQA